MQSTRFVFLSACLGMLLFGMSFITLGSVAAPLQLKFQLDGITAGSLFSILPIGILLGSLVFGPVADRYGYKIIMVLSCLLMFAGFQGIAYAPTLLLLRTSIFIFGFGGGIINGATNASVADASGNKAANISLVGVFFAIGALGMPFILGILEAQFSFEAILSAVGYLTLLVGAVIMMSRFPAPKQSEGIPSSETLSLLKEPVLLLIGFFLFCQSSFEGIVNNWTTTYLIEKLAVESDNALYSLSSYVVGMALMRLLVGGLFRQAAPRKILLISFLLLFVGTALLGFSNQYFLATAGLVAMGAGLASGFPVMLGFVGNLYARLSGTAFSIVLTIALLGNMLVNLLMGFIANEYGVRHLTTMSFVLLTAMVILTLNILKKTDNPIKQAYAGKTMAQ